MDVDGMRQRFKEKVRQGGTSPLARARFWEIDLLRGCAIILMLGFHWTVDQYLFRGVQPRLSPFVLSIWQMVTAGLFLLLAGVSLTFHRGHPEQQRRSTGGNFQRNRNTGRGSHWRRGIIILSWGLLITVITRLFLPKDYIVFGILHLIGTAVFISQPLLNLKTWNLALGMIIIGLGIYFRQQRVTFPWLLWAGFIPEGFVSVDYFPIFPWYGVILIGIFIGKSLYGEQGRNFSLGEPPRCQAVQWLCLLGRNSLLIYLVHQPVLLLLLLLLSMIRK
jgi:uncharacterized membrane protein